YGAWNETKVNSANAATGEAADEKKAATKDDEIYNVWSEAAEEEVASAVYSKEGISTLYSITAANTVSSRFRRDLSIARPFFFTGNRGEVGQQTRATTASGFSTEADRQSHSSLHLFDA